MSPSPSIDNLKSSKLCTINTTSDKPSFTVQHKVNLQQFNTMALSCIADTLITVHNDKQLESVLADYQANSTNIDKNSPLFILSGGSNVLLPPHLHATILRPMILGVKVIKDTPDHVYIEVSAGENWHNLVVQTVNNGWYGLENLALIPGLTGAAPVQNIGAYGVQLEDCMTHIRALHLPTLSWHEFDKPACKFGYRDSVFKQQLGQWLISKVGFKLHKDDTQVNTKYGDVQHQALALAAQQARTEITPNDVMHAIIAIRQNKLPDPKVLPNCGSFFKNPVIPTQQFARLKDNYPNIVGYAQENDHTKVAAGWLIDNAGLKGDGVSPILTHNTQALVLTNHVYDEPSHSNNVTQEAVAATQAYIQKTIMNNYGISLEREPMWVESNGDINLSNTIML